MRKTNAKQEYETKHDWVGKIIHWELSKKLKFDHMYNLKSFLENETHNFFWDFDLQTVTNRSFHFDMRSKPCDCQQKNKKRTSRKVDFIVQADEKIRLKESKKRNKYIDLVKKPKKLWGMKVSMISVVIRAFSSHQRIDTGTWGLGNKRTSGYYPNYHIIKIGQNNENIPGDLRRHFVAQTPVKKTSTNNGVTALKRVTK